MLKILVVVTVSIFEKVFSPAKLEDVFLELFFSAQPPAFALDLGHTRVVCCTTEEVVRFLVEAGDELDAMGGLGATALHIAAERGHGSLVRYLLEVKASAQKANQRGKMALHMAALSGHVEILQLLVSQGDGMGLDGIEKLDF